MRKNCDQYGYHFNEFLNLAERASLTLKREQKPDGEGLQETRRFNYQQSLQKYSESLSEFYQGIDSSVNRILEKLPMKIHKLNYLSGMLAEIQGVELLVSEDETGQLKHSYFTYTDVSDDEFRNETILGQDAIQSYLVTLKRYVVMLKKMIEGIKGNIEMVQQSELPLPEHQRPKPYDSTLDIPDKFMDYLIVKNGIANIKKEFIPSEDDLQAYEHVSYDEETETRIYYDRDYETGEHIEIKSTFPNYLLNILYLQVNNFKYLVDEKISHLKNAEEITFYITVLTSRIKYLQEVYKNTPSIKKYEKIGDALRAFLRYIYQKYTSFSPEPDQVVRQALIGSKLFLNPPKQDLLPKSKTPQMFRWLKGTPERLNVLLHERLIGTYIENVDLELFAKVFSGGYVDPSPLLKWIDRPKNNGGVNKVNLLFLFKKLAEAGLIDVEYDTSEMIGKLEYIFTDSNGERLKNWAQSKSSVGKIIKLTPQQKEIEKIVILLNS